MRSRCFPSLLQTRKLLCKCLSTRASSSITYSQLSQIRSFSTDNDDGNSNKDNPKEKDSVNLVHTVGTKHKLFADQDATFILDVDEERDRVILDELQEVEERADPYAGLNLKRGVTGVFDIEDLVELLQREDAKQIFVAKVPEEYSYVDYMVVVTAKSVKHIHGLASFVRKIYKLKRNESDHIPKLEGKDSTSWVALDLGNIALHIFKRDIRPTYDLETLWSVGPEYDELSQKIDEDTILNQFNAFLADLKPAETNSQTKK